MVDQVLKRIKRRLSDGGRQGRKRYADDIPGIKCIFVLFPRRLSVGEGAGIWNVVDCLHVAFQHVELGRCATNVFCPKTFRLNRSTCPLTCATPWRCAPTANTLSTCVPKMFSLFRHRCVLLLQHATFCLAICLAFLALGHGVSNLKWPKTLFLRALIQLSLATLSGSNNEQHKNRILAGLWEARASMYAFALFCHG